MGPASAAESQLFAARKERPVAGPEGALQSALENEYPLKFDVGKNLHHYKILDGGAAEVAWVNRRTNEIQRQIVSDGRWFPFRARDESQKWIWREEAKQWERDSRDIEDEKEFERLLHARGILTRLIPERNKVDLESSISTTGLNPKEREDHIKKVAAQHNELKKRFERQEALWTYDKRVNRERDRLLEYLVTFLVLRDPFTKSISMFGKKANAALANHAIDQDMWTDIIVVVPNFAEDSASAIDVLRLDAVTGIVGLMKKRSRVLRAYTGKEGQAPTLEYASVPIGTHMVSGASISSAPIVAVAFEHEVINRLVAEIEKIGSRMGKEGEASKAEMRVIRDAEQSLAFDQLQIEMILEIESQLQGDFDFLVRHRSEHYGIIDAQILALEEGRRKNQAEYSAFVNARRGVPREKWSDADKTEIETIFQRTVQANEEIKSLREQKREYDATIDSLLSSARAMREIRMRRIAFLKQADTDGERKGTPIEEATFRSKLAQQVVHAQRNPEIMEKIASISKEAYRDLYGDTGADNTLIHEIRSSLDKLPPARLVDAASLAPPVRTVAPAEETPPPPEPEPEPAKPAEKAAAEMTEAELRASIALLKERRRQIEIQLAEERMRALKEQREQLDKS